MKHKTRRLSIGQKIVIAAVVVLVAIVALLGYNSYVRMEENLVAMGIEQAGVAARIAVTSLDADALAKIEFGDTESEAYTKILDKMDEVAEICNVEFMYTLILKDGVVFYQASTDGEAYEKFDYSYADLKDVFDGKLFVQDFIDETEDGALLTAYAPIKDSNGNVVAALGSDYNASEIVSNLSKSKDRILQIGFIGSLIAIIVLVLIAKRITKGIWKVNDKLYELVHNEGDLTQTMDIKTGDEMEIMANNFNELLSYIKRIMSHISTDSVDLNDSTNAVAEEITVISDNIVDVSATMEEMSAGMQETTAALTQINTALNSAFDMIKEIANNADEGNAFSRDIQTKAMKINTDAEQDKAKAMAKTDDMIEVLSSAIEESKAVEQINSLTDNILSITSQTNLLALNASIEAARAGEAGRGFAVVADEIGNLAKDSAQAATEIRKVSEDVITAVNKLSDEAKSVIEFLKQVVADGYGSLIDVSTDYNSDATDFHGTMEAFAVQANKFSETMDEIRENLDAINIAVEENAKGIVNVAEVSTKLTESMSDISEKADVNRAIVDQLGHEVRKFKIE